jgi:hypothetical protein
MPENTQMNQIPYVMVPRMQIVWSVLEGALDVGDAYVAAACRRLIVAHRLGWRKHRDPADWRLVREFGEVVDGERPFPERP